LRPGARFQRHAVPNLVNLDRQDLVRTGALGTIRLQAALLVEATSPAILSANPGRDDAVAGGTRMLHRRLHQGSSHARPRNILGDVKAAELRGPGGDVRVGARQHVHLADDLTGQLRDGDGRAGGELSEPLREVGGGLLHRQGTHVRFRQEIAVAPLAGGHVHLGDGSGIAWSCRPLDQVLKHNHSLAPRQFPTAWGALRSPRSRISERGGPEGPPSPPRVGPASPR
jgi:hypothetical protein